MKVLECCIKCEFHEIVQMQRGHPDHPVGEVEYMSYCTRENCYSENSDCVLTQALDKFLEDNKVKSIHIINKELHGRS